MRILKSKKFWIGAVAGTIAGSAVLRKIGVSVPRVG